MLKLMFAIEFRSYEFPFGNDRHPYTVASEYACITWKIKSHLKWIFEHNTQTSTTSIGQISMRFHLVNDQTGKKQSYGAHIKIVCVHHTMALASNNDHHFTLILNEMNEMTGEKEERDWTMHWRNVNDL